MDALDVPIQLRPNRDLLGAEYALSMQHHLAEIINSCQEDRARLRGCMQQTAIVSSSQSGVDQPLSERA